MRRLTQTLGALLVATAVAAPATHAVAKPAPEGTFTRHTFTAAGLPSRDYWLYVPAGKPRTPRPLLVFLHGCNVTAEESAQITRFNELAAAQGFVVAYPQQAVTTNTSAPLA